MVRAAVRRVRASGMDAMEVFSSNPVLLEIAEDYRVDSGSDAISPADVLSGFCRYCALIGVEVGHARRALVEEADAAKAAADALGEPAPVESAEILRRGKRRRGCWRGRHALRSIPRFHLASPNAPSSRLLRATNTRTRFSRWYCRQLTAVGRGGAAYFS